MSQKWLEFVEKIFPTHGQKPPVGADLTRLVNSSLNLLTDEIKANSKYLTVEKSKTKAEIIIQNSQGGNFKVRVFPTREYPPGYNFFWVITDKDTIQYWYQDGFQGLVNMYNLIMEEVRVMDLLPPAVQRQATPSEYIDFANKLFSNEYQSSENKFKELSYSWPQLIIKLITSSVDGIVGEVSPINLLTVQFENRNHPELGYVQVTLYPFEDISDKSKLDRNIMEIESKDGKNYFVKISEGAEGVINAYSLILDLVSELTSNPYIEFANKLFDPKYKDTNNSKELEMLFDSWPSLFIDQIESSFHNIVGEALPVPSTYEIVFKNRKHPELGVVKVTLYDQNLFVPGNYLMTVENKDGREVHAKAREGAQGLINLYHIIYEYVKELDREPNPQFEDELLSLNDVLPPSLQQNDPKALLSILRVILGGSYVASELFK